MFTTSTKSRPRIPDSTGSTSSTNAIPQRVSILTLILVLVANACVSVEARPAATSLRSDVYIQLMALGVCRHVSFRSFPGVPTFAAELHPEARR
jgi:hypothetical protein